MNQRARIFRRPKSAMQSGPAGQRWRLEFEPAAQQLDPLTGWAGSGDTRAQVRLDFPSMEAAVAYAKAQGLAFEVAEPAAPAALKPKAYADNFRFGRTDNWSH
jgi:hypothetical protein